MVIQALHAFLDESLYQIELQSVADIAELLHDSRPEVLTSTDGTIDFWFPHYQDARANRHATEMLLATTRFTAHDVPLLRSTIVVAGHDSTGSLASLNDVQMGRLLNNEPSWAEIHVLDRRFNRDIHLQRQRRAVRKAMLHPDWR